MNDLALGPVPRDEFKELATLPHGEAVKRIRSKYDPLYGLAPGEKVEWLVTYEATIEGTAMVKAATKEEAEKLADNLPLAEIDWETPTSNMDIDSMHVEPIKPTMLIRLTHTNAETY